MSTRSRCKCIEGIRVHLPKSLEGNHAAALECLLASWRCNFGLFAGQTLLGIGSGLRHAVGGMTRAPHAEVTCVVLPHVLRFNLPAVPEIIGPLADVLGCDVSGCSDIAGKAATIADFLAGFISDLGLPTSLREFGVSSADWPRLIESAMDDFAVAANPRPLSVEALTTILQAATT